MTRRHRPTTGYPSISLACISGSCSVPNQVPTAIIPSPPWFFFPCIHLIGDHSAGFVLKVWNFKFDVFPHPDLRGEATIPSFLLTLAWTICHLFDEMFAHFFQDCGHYRLFQLFDESFTCCDSLNSSLHPSYSYIRMEFWHLEWSLSQNRMSSAVNHEDGPFGKLPDHLLIEIFVRVPVLEWAGISCVKKRWADLFRGECLWQAALARSYPFASCATRWRGPIPRGLSKRYIIFVLCLCLQMHLCMNLLDRSFALNLWVLKLLHVVEFDVTINSAIEG